MCKVWGDAVSDLPHGDELGATKQWEIRWDVAETQETIYARAALRRSLGNTAF